MEPLSGLDRAFLDLESANAPMNVIGVILLDPAEGGAFGYEELVARVESRLPVVAVWSTHSQTRSTKRSRPRS